MLIERIKADSLLARKSKSASAPVLVTLLGEANTLEKTFNPARPLTDAEVTGLVQKFLKNNADALAKLDHLPEDRRAETRTKLEGERQALEVYLPKQLDDKQIERIARNMVEDGAQMGQIMAFLKTNHAGQYDGKKASEIVKRAVQGS